jgi:uncharacterized DUF497 family protein
MDYEWDDDKAAANIVKHGIDFLDAIGAFVVTTIRAENLCRIISARRATRHEQDRYYADKH